MLVSYQNSHIMAPNYSSRFSRESKMSCLFPANCDITGGRVMLWAVKMSRNERTATNNLEKNSCHCPLKLWFPKWGPGTPRGPWEGSRESPTTSSRKYCIFPPEISLNFPKMHNSNLNIRWLKNIIQSQINCEFLVAISKFCLLGGSWSNLC